MNWDREVVRRLLAVLSFVLAPFLALHALASAGVVLDPVRNWNGFSLGREALARVQVQQEPDRGAIYSVRDPGPALARQAFAREPLATDAIFVLLIHMDPYLDDPRQATALQLTSQLAKRSRKLGALTLQLAAAEGDVTGAIAAVDRLVVVHPKLARTFAQALAPQLSDERQIGVLEHALGDDPSWASAFWMVAPAYTQGLDNLLKLRLREPAGTTVQSDVFLLQALVQDDRYDDAFAFWKLVSRAQDNPIAFVDSDELPPFGWNSVHLANRGMTAAGEGSYVVHASEEVSGELARQLVRLAPGEYRLSVLASPSVQVALQAALQCADSSDPLQWKNAPRSVDWQVLPGGCQWHWLVLGIDTWETGKALNGTIAQIRFDRV